MLGFELTRLLRSSAVYGIGGVLQRFLNLFLLPIFARVLTTEDYGVVALINLVNIGLTGLYNLGTGNSMGILYYRETELFKRHTIVWSTAVLLVFSGTLLTIILAVFSPYISLAVFQSSVYANLFAIAFFSMLVSTITQPFYMYLRMEEKPKQYVILTIGGTLIGAISGIVFVLILRWGVFGIMVAGLVGQGLMLVAVAAVVARRIPFTVDRRFFRPLVRIGFPSIFGLFAFLIIDYADRQMLQRFLGLDQLGIYSIGYSFGMAIFIFVGAFEAAWAPFFMSFVTRLDDAKQVFGKVLKYYIIGSGLLVTIFFAAAKPLVVLLLPQAFEGAFVVVGLVAASYMVKGCYLIILPGIYFSHKLYWQSGIEWAAAAVNIALNLWWIPRFGIAGAAFATLVSYLTLPVLSWVVARRYMAVDYEWPKIGIAVIALTSTSFLVTHFATVATIGISIAASMLAVSAATILLILGTLGTSERKLAFERIMNFGRKTI